MSTAIVWFRRDLRITDHPALAHAAEHHARVLPVYVHSPQEDGDWAPGGAARWWLHHALDALQTRLGERGAPLILRRGPSAEALAALVRESGADALYYSRLLEPLAARRDAQVEDVLRGLGVRVRRFNAALLVEPERIATRTGEPYRVFTPFWKTASAHAASPTVLPAPERLAAVDGVRGEALTALDLLPRLDWAARFGELWSPGEDGAHARLDAFCRSGLRDYDGGRNLPGSDGTSRLSPHLHWGEISPRQAVLRVQRSLRQSDAAGLARSGERFITELGWREFAHHLLHHYPHTPGEPLDPHFRRLAWRGRSQYRRDLRAWQQGRTGIPIVDAGMRQLWTHGWMHNRVRMIVASFLTKNLLIPWQDGAAWFWDTLVDASLANNTLGWQWVAGCGADAAPYFRVFNPLLQSERFDRDGEYLRRWLPELGDARGKALHDPPASAREAGGYPAPIVALGASRQRALDAWRQMRDSADRRP